jgi:hypothetical protein
MTAYEFIGPDAEPYPWGVVKPGDIAYFPDRAPNGDWVPVTVPAPEAAPDDEPEAAPEVAVPEMPRRPNKAAPAADWVAYAKADGTFPGDPDTATRKAIVDHYSDGGDQ